METINEFESNLYIDFTAEEVENFLIRQGYEIKKVIGRGPMRIITGNDGGGGVELSDEFIGMKEITVAIKKDEKPPSDEEMLRTGDNRPDYIFKKVLKQRLLELPATQLLI